MTAPSHNLLIRPPRQDEARLLTSLALRSKAHWGYSEAFIEACRAELTFTAQELKQPGCDLRLAEVGATVAGFYALRRRNAAETELDAMFVAPEFIGAGIGRALLADALERARASGAARLVVQSDPHAEDFYRRAGGVPGGMRESGSIAGRFLPVLEFVLDPAPGRSGCRGDEPYAE